MRFLSSIIVCATIATIMSCSTQNQKDETVMKEENAVIENIMARRSIRKYKAEPVKRETMDIILKSGINAPSGMNKQSWEIRVMDNPETISRLKNLMVQANPEVKPEAVEGCFRNAPTLVFIASDNSYDFSTIDCGLLSQNIMLSAWSLGVGSVCLGSPIRYICKSEEAMSMLGFSNDYKLAICIGLGYADEAPDAKPRDFNKIKYLN